MSRMYKFVVISLLLLINCSNGSITGPASSRSDAEEEIYVLPEGHEGDAKWYPGNDGSGNAQYVFCNEGQWAIGFQFKSESDQGGSTDDTAGNGLRLECSTPNGLSTETIETSNPKNWGSWDTTTRDCGGGFVSGFRTSVEPETTDDTTLNCVEMRCSNDVDLLPGNCRNWGTWSPADTETFESCNDGSYICGLREKFEPDESVWDGELDETGLNAVRFYCCAFTAAPTPLPTTDPTNDPTSDPTSQPT
eukprot:455337_1